MADDPYRVLGVSPDASDDEIKAAYRRMAKKYHPDINHAPDAEAKMKEVNDAYSQLMKMKRGGGQQTGSSYGGNSSYGGSQQSDPFGWGPFGNPFGGFGGYGGSHQQSSSRSGAPEFDTVRRYIQAGEYSQALNMLNSLPRTSAEWYYWDARANMGLGNRMAALNDARQAVNMDPGNMEYRQLLSQLEGGANTYRSQGQAYGFPDLICSNPCLSCMVANMLCNCCCPGRMCFC